MDIFCIYICLYMKNCLPDKIFKVTRYANALSWRKGFGFRAVNFTRQERIEQIIRSVLYTFAFICFSHLIINICYTRLPYKAFITYYLFALQCKLNMLIEIVDIIAVLQY